MTRERVVRRSAAAVADIEAQVEYLLAHGGPAVAERYTSSVERTLASLREFPLAGAPGSYRSRALRGVRMKIVDGFRDALVFYRVRRGTIEIVRVLHAARDRDRHLGQT